MTATLTAPATSSLAKTTTRQRVELARYTITSAGERIVYGQRVDGAVRLTDKQDGLRCVACGRVYPIIDDIPVMLVDKARQNS